MKIIDILNKMAKGELEDGFEFKYDNDTYKYNKKEDEIVSVEYGFCLGNYYKVENILNDEVEIIEENKEIEELEIQSIKEYEDYIIDMARTDENVKDLARKINEIIKAVKQLDIRVKESEGK